MSLWSANAAIAVKAAFTSKSSKILKRQLIQLIINILIMNNYIFKILQKLIQANIMTA